eukprot:scaffold224850_cov99-Cyclotella_meneghiniana.AAC.1
MSVKALVVKFRAAPLLTTDYCMAMTALGLGRQMNNNALDKWLCNNRSCQAHMKLCDTHFKGR